MVKKFDAIDILLVEDNPQDIELTLRALKKNNVANSFFIAEDGKKALDYIFARNEFKDRDLSNLPKVILLDLKLPKIDGLSVLKQLKSREETKGIPVVILTSSSEDPDIKTAYEYGANSYVIKPVGFAEFLEAMKTLGFYWLLINRQC